MIPYNDKRFQKTPIQCILSFSTYRVKYANLHLNGDMHDNGNAKYAESGGVWKLIFFFLLLCYF